MLTHNRFITHLVLIFSDLDKTQIYKMPFRDSAHQEIEKVKSYYHWNVFKPNEHTEDYCILKPNDESFLFETGDKKYIYVREKVISFETNDIIVKNPVDIGFKDIKFPYAYGEENFYFMFYQNHVPIQQNKSSTEKNECQYLY